MKKRWYVCRAQVTPTSFSYGKSAGQARQEVWGFDRAREVIDYWLCRAHERRDHPPARPPRGAGRKHAVEDGDWTYWIEVLEEQEDEEESEDEES